MVPTEPFPSEQGSLLDNDPSAFPDVSPTGDTSVDEVLRTLTLMPELKEADQQAAYERLHDGLLAELNTEQS